MNLQVPARDVRVEDYLNDKLQTVADLANLDNLLQNVKHQQALLKEQLTAAEQDLSQSTEESEAHASALLQQARAFKKQQADVDRRLLIVTQSETSDDAIGKFEEDIKALRRLDVAKGYVELLAEVEQLSAETRRNFNSSPQAALRPYLRLQKLAIRLKKAQPAAEDAAPHLVDHVDQTAQNLWKQMKDAFASDFEEVLMKMKWPSKGVTLAGSLEPEWTAGVEKLLDLQDPSPTDGKLIRLVYRELQSQSDHVGPSEDPLVLLPLEIMVKPLDLRFQYHFSGDRPTNKLDKPEYFLSHIMGLLNTYDDFFAIHLQPILRNRFKTSNLAMTSIFFDATSALITALLPMLRRKMLNVMPQIAKQPQLLSHFIHELMGFDISLRDEWGYDGGRGIEGWKGLTWEVLVKKDWFNRWFEVEQKFIQVALSRYQSIIDAPSSFDTDFESVSSSDTKPTNAAIRVNDLLETITDRYRPLPSFSQKLRFIIDIQINIFDLFHSRLVKSLEAYLSFTSPLARTVHSGVLSSNNPKSQLATDLDGLAGIERLARVYGSAEYLEKKMRDWSDDVFFLELWEELQDRANNPNRTHVGGNMSVAHVADKTSSAVGNEEEQGALFDETAGAYRRLRVRTEGVLSDAFVQQARDALRPYGKINPWSAMSSTTSQDPAMSLAISAELDGPIRLLQSYLEFLASALARPPLRRIVRQVMLAMQTVLWDGVLMRYHFSTMGAAQFARDVKGVWEVVDRWIGRGQGEMGMRTLGEALVLLDLDGLPLDNTIQNADIGRGLTLKGVEERLFRSNESAREVLEELGLEVVSESDARAVLERRVDLSG
ncbi:MAG: hypothetical protein Q9174_003615 [Haloplaca sp. 1 TL-2023]